VSDWTFVCATSQLLPGEKAVVWDGDTAIVVINLDGMFYALEDRCTHDEFELSAGEVDTTENSIQCVLHGARFDIRDGSALCAPAYEPVAKFPVRVEDGLVWTRDDRV
jgi:3-phenylpropionate/trans-cinnamate dioxygenase ferredoxin component